MSIARSVVDSVARFESGRVFSYQDLPAYGVSPVTTMKAVSRLIKANKINKLSKGRFYKAKQGVLGELKPSDSELLKTVVYKNGQLKGYLTGVALYNQLGLTTQIPRVVTVATAGGRQKKDFGTLKARLVTARAPLTKESDIVLLQYLDVLRGINTIPDAEVNESLTRMQRKIADLDEKQAKRIQRVAIDFYNAQARALLGLLLVENDQWLNPALKKTLNPLTKYKLKLDEKKWADKKSWNIE